MVDHRNLQDRPETVTNSHVAGARENRGCGLMEGFHDVGLSQGDCDGRMLSSENHDRLFSAVFIQDLSALAVLRRNGARHLESWNTHSADRNSSNSDTGDPGEKRQAKVLWLRRAPKQCASR